LRAKRSNPGPQAKAGLLRRFAPRNDGTGLKGNRLAAKLSSSFLLTRYLPLYSSRHLPSFSISAAQTQQLLACIGAASAINSLAT
jgi:hypothetical protein